MQLSDGITETFLYFSNFYCSYSHETYVDNTQCQQLWKIEIIIALIKLNVLPYNLKKTLKIKSLQSIPCTQLPLKSHTSSLLCYPIHKACFHLCGSALDSAQLNEQHPRFLYGL